MGNILFIYLVSVFKVLGIILYFEYNIKFSKFNFFKEIIMFYFKCKIKLKKLVCIG